MLHLVILKGRGAEMEEEDTGYRSYRGNGVGREGQGLDHRERER